MEFEPFARATEGFKKSFNRLPPSIRKKAEKAIRYFKKGIRSKGLNVEKLQNNYYSLRIDRNYRIIFEQDSEESPPLFIFAGKHDDAYQFFDVALRKQASHTGESRFRKRHPDEKTYEIRDVSELIDFMNQKRKHFILHMPDEYRHIISEEFDRNILVRGVSGSGKTTILLYRAHKFVRTHPGEKVIFLTFNTQLRDLINAVLDDICRDEKQRSAIEVDNLDHWIINRLKFWRSDFNEETLVSHLGEPLCLPFSIIQTEISRTIVGDMNLTREEYLKARNRVINLSDEDKEYIFSVFETLREVYTEDQEIRSYSPIRHLVAYQLMKENKEDFPRYAHAFVDEVQDLHPIQFEIIKMMLKPGGTVSLAGSNAQSIYNLNFDWENVRKAFSPKEYVLDTAFRYTDAIGQLNSRVLRFIEDEEPIKPRFVYTSKFEPVVKRFSTFAEEARFIIKEIKAQKLSPEHTAVLWPTHRLKNEFELYLEFESSLATKLNSLTYHSSKGLEFRNVFVAGGNKDNLRSFYLDEQDGLDPSVFRLVHVVLTRALERLYVTWHGEVSPYLSFVREVK